MICILISNISAGFSQKRGEFPIMEIFLGRTAPARRRPGRTHSMKTLGATLIALVILAVMFWGFFYYSVHLAKESASAPVTATTADSSAINSSAKALPTETITSTPSVNFRGPTGAPHIIGPSGPPPNY